MDFEGTWQLPDKNVAIIGQCKKYQDKLGARYLRELEGTLSHSGPNTVGLFVCASGR